MNDKSAVSERSMVLPLEGHDTSAADSRGSQSPPASQSVSTDTGKLVFPFGQNWERFLARISEQRIQQARESVASFLGMTDLRGKSFIDIGCGSGLFSYAAFLLGAERIVSFDADPFSVTCARYMREKAGQPANWTVLQGSVLDTEFLSSFQGFDIVYSWGVLHHTGSMWEAIRNSARLVPRNGMYYIALYNRIEGKWGSEHWVKVKRFYNTSSVPVKRLVEFYYTLTHPVGRQVLRLRNPFKALKNYGGERGMHWKTDLVDWLGGYPYEFATVDEVFTFMKKEFPSFTLENIKTEPNLGNNWFLFKNRA
jgi:2-polyprenyl-6-hydroxyphenyl methylase/3-demethylubiquinone-9 3-methyltransferase